MMSLSRKVSTMLEECDFRGAVRLACSDDNLGPFNSITFTT